MKARHFIFATGLLCTPLIALAFALTAWPVALWRVCYSLDQDAAQASQRTARPATAILKQFLPGYKKGKESFSASNTELVP
jgi:hypothetical protein